MFILNAKRYTLNPRNGFTLIEILLVVILLAALMGLTIPVGLRFLSNEQLTSAGDDVIQTLRRAQELSRIQERDSSYGVFFTSSGYTFFKGSSYSTRDIVFDEIYELPSGVTVATNLTASDIVLGKLNGIPSESGLISLSNSAGSENIEINSAGRISLL